MKAFHTYVILTEPKLPHTTIAEICVEQNIKMLQIREKRISDKQLLSIARDLRRITKGTNTRLVINDRPDIAILCDADYLHLGQDDMDITDARKLVGNMKIGVSTHSIALAMETLRKNPDYIGFGPLYPTNAKTIPDPPVGLELLKEVVMISSVPVVGIGGVFPENISEVRRCGVGSIAMVRYFMQAESETILKRRIQEINTLFNS